MFLEGLDALDQQIVSLLIENARLSYSDIGEKVGLSRVAVKSRIQALAAAGRHRGVHHHHQPPKSSRGRCPATLSWSSPPQALGRL